MPSHVRPTPVGLHLTYKKSSNWHLSSNFDVSQMTQKSQPSN